MPPVSRPRRALVRALLALALGEVAACATWKPPNAFVVEGVAWHASEAWLAQLRGNWNPGVAALAGHSRSPSALHDWVLDYIAVSEATGARMCEHLALTRIDPLPLRPVAFTSDGAPHVIKPAKYNEDWVVVACGREQHWRVLDDPSVADYEYDLTVLKFERVVDASASRPAHAPRLAQTRLAPMLISKASTTVLNR